MNKKNVIVISFLLLLSLGCNILFISPYLIDKAKRDETCFFDSTSTDSELIDAVLSASMNIEQSQMIKQEFHGLRDDIKAMFRPERNSQIFCNYYIAYNFAGISYYALKYRDEKAITYLSEKVDSWIETNGNLTYDIVCVDQCPIGLTYINLYKITGIEKYKEAAMQIYAFLKKSRIKGNLIPYNNSINNFSDAVAMYVPFLMEYYELTNDTLARRIAVDNINHYKKMEQIVEQAFPFMDIISKLELN